MSSLSFPAWSMLAVVTLVLSLLITQLSIRYAHRREMLDLPGKRRSHLLPTPRGGGIGIVLAVLVGLLVFVLVTEQGPNSFASMVVFASIILIALVGWIDDHKGLRAPIRFLAHCLAALVLGLPALTLLLPGFTENPAWPLVGVALLVAAGAVVWSINLHNFMDGINGLLSLQAFFVFIVLALICLDAGRSGEAQSIGLFAAATLGFIPFNFPRARVFMGDVGSGVIGLLVVIAVGWQIAAVPAAWVAGLIASSAFVVDSTATLLSRMFSGRRWYSAHREHLYQWLVRSGFSHVKVTGFYMLWNLLIVVPALIGLRHSAGPGSGNQGDVESSSILASVYVMAVLVWVVGKRFCLNKSMIALRTRKL